MTGIDRKFINEIMSFRMPPNPIRNVLAGVMTMMKQEDQSWINMKKFLSSPSVKDDLVNFDAQAVTPAVR